jgi:hypothetical protein
VVVAGLACLDRRGGMGFTEVVEVDPKDREVELRFTKMAEVGP